jgi:hypothetical protein
MLCGIRKALDSGTAFDFAYTPKEGDLLSIHITYEVDAVPFESPFEELATFIRSLMRNEKLTIVQHILAVIQKSRNGKVAELRYT